jgi:hypothetical protein
MDEAQAFHFVSHPYGSADEIEMNNGYDEIIKRIYKQIYEYGTETTRQHIESMGLS